MRPKLCMYVFTITAHLLGSIKMHLNWAIKNCEGNGVRLRSLVDDIPNHYEVHEHIHEHINACVQLHVHA